jgi:hypothetical protein
MPGKGKTMKFSIQINTGTHSLHVVWFHGRLFQTVSYCLSGVSAQVLCLQYYQEG